MLSRVLILGHIFADGRPTRRHTLIVPMLSILLRVIKQNRFVALDLKYSGTSIYSLLV